MADITYYKIIPYNETDYRSGLHLTSKSLKGDSFVSTGQLITTLEYIPKFFFIGVDMYEIKLPSKNLLIERDPDVCGWRTNKIILGKKYSLFDPETYKKFGWKMEDNHHLVDNASATGNIDFLNYWIKTGLNLKYSVEALVRASENGHVNVLNWWLASKLEMRYTENAMDWASMNGHIDVLIWWLKSGLPLKYSECSMDWASERGNTEVLIWWKNSGLTLKYSGNSMYWASGNGHVNVLEWWYQFFPKKLQCNMEYLLAGNSYQGTVVRWWARFGITLA